ncbi:MAG: hypothetical protein Q4E70_01405 [Candidatus Saccharibacteria bacterium]|nr:hypothetical protein [Candidatus Saccharibacteria bacterium]
MTPQEDEKLIRLFEQVKNLPEGQELPEEIINELTQDQLTAVYIEKMMLDKGVEPNDSLRAVLREKLDDAVNRKLVNALPVESAKKLESAIDNGANDEELENIIAESGIDVERITEEAMTAFREKYLSLEEVA